MTHKASQWTKQAWFRAEASTGMLTFNIVGPADPKLTAVTYAFYHGHLIETFLSHFDRELSSGSATAMPDGGDMY